jgi:hypothetical protein
MRSSIPFAVTIASAASLSGAATVAGRLVTGINMPTSWTAADLTFQGAEQVVGGTFQNIYDSDGTELTVSAAASRAIALTSVEMDLLSAFAAIKVRSGTAGVAVAQAADRTITLVLK